VDNAQQNFAVMFADVAGSTRIYERLGDNIANELIDGAINQVSEVIAKHQGTVVKTIGDEVMCRFDTADQAISAACEIQEVMDKKPIEHGVILMFRIGLHYGPALLKDDGDIFGDAVNLAARMAGVAKARQIMTTDDTECELSSHNLSAKCREVDRINVKGKEAPIAIVEVMWEENDNVTRMVTSAFSNDLLGNKPLNLFYNDDKFTLEHGSAAYTFGRDAQCNQMIDSTLVSRIHAKIENRRGKFILIDESTNGTFLKVEDKAPVFLRREEIVLQGHGIISFGEELNEDSSNVVRYSL